MIVLDASAAIEWLLQTPKAATIEARLFSKTAQPRWHAPHLLDVEVAQVLRKSVAKGAMSDARGQEALQDLLDLPSSVASAGCAASYTPTSSITIGAARISA